MPLTQSKLVDGLKKLDPTSDVSLAADRFASAWIDYFMDASVSGVPVGGSLDSAKSTMKAVLLGMAVPGAAAAVISASIAAFWGIVAGSAASLWTLPPPAAVTVATPPPTLAGLPALITATFLANTAGSLSKDAAAEVLGAVLHASGGLGGLALVVIPPSGPAPTPIL